MSSYNNLDPSSLPPYDTTTPQNDMYQQYQVSQGTPNYHVSQRPPGAGTAIRSPPPSQPYQTKLSLQHSLPLGQSGMGEHASRTFTQFPISGQTDGSNNTFYAPSSSRSAPLSPSHPYGPPASVPGELLSSRRLPNQR
jgi:hypothetical protein